MNSRLGRAALVALVLVMVLGWTDVLGVRVLGALAGGIALALLLAAVAWLFSDNCTPTAQLRCSQSPPAGTVLPGGASYLITVTIWDAAGNSNQCTAGARRQPPE